jgi:hypothetical protein
LRCDVDAGHIRSELRRRQSRRPVTAPQIEHFHPAFDANSPHERFSAVTHGRRDSGEIPFFPESLVRIRWSHHFSQSVHLLA